MGRVSSKLYSPFTRVNLVVDGRDWVLARVGRYISSAVREQTGLACHPVKYYQGIRNQIVHFGSRNAYLGDGHHTVHSSNRVVFTWFHGNDSDPNPEMQSLIRALPGATLGADLVVTSSTIARSRLIGWGVPDEKIVVIPLGVDLDIFKAPPDGQRERMRERLGIPKDAVCIGSFQKDGVGWGDGMEPKLVKGPDIFLRTIKRLAPKHKLSVLLTGPSRGYVKKGLDEMGVPYNHVFLRNYHDIAPFFSCLDLYMVTARDEGGPMAILECMATGVPVISTRVGMAVDVIRDRENGILTEIEDCEALESAATELIENASLRDALSGNGLATVINYDWRAIGLQYYQQVYHPMLSGRLMARE